MIFLHKLIPVLASPLFLVVILLLAGIVAKSRSALLAALLILLVASNPLLGRYTAYLLEKDSPPIEISGLPEADAFVVLSGMTTTFEKPDGSLGYEFGGAVDRFMAAVDAVRMKKVKQLIFTAGQLPWSKGLPEGEILKRRAVDMGIPAGMIRLTPPVENTEDEAKAVRKMFQSGRNTIVLVTSAFHMPRAARLFEAQGFEVIRFPVDFHQTADALTPMDFLPSASALEQTALFEREMLGRLFYALKYAGAA